MASNDNNHIKELANKYKEGKRIFKEYCNTCHFAPDKRIDDSYTFDNLFERLPAPSESYFVKYILDSKQLLLTGDKYAIALDKAYNSRYTHEFKDSLSTFDLDNLIIYIRVAVKLRSKGN